MRGYKIKILGWIFISLIFIDMITTIIGIKYLKLRELNPIGYNDSLFIMFVISIVSIFIMIKYYHKSKEILYSLSMKRYYNKLIALLYFAILLRFGTIFNNIIMIISKMV